MHHMQFDGKPDEEQLQQVVRHLISKHKVAPSQIKKDAFLTFDENYKLLVMSSFLTEEQAHNAVYIHHPDIVIFDVRKIKLIIEVDGSIHKSKSGIKRTEKRNFNYDESKIPYIILDLEDLEYSGIDWLDHLDQQLDFLVKNGQ